MTYPILREWRPGDGLTCRFSSRAAEPCGPPVRTREVLIEPVNRKARVIRQALCEKHSRGDANPELVPSRVRPRAKQIVLERFASEEPERYAAWLAEAIAQVESEAKAPTARAS